MNTPLYRLAGRVHFVRLLPAVLSRSAKLIREINGFAQILRGKSIARSEPNADPQLNLHQAALLRIQNKSTQKHMLLQTSWGRMKEKGRKPIPQIHQWLHQMRLRWGSGPKEECSRKTIGGQRGAWNYKRSNKTDWTLERIWGEAWKNDSKPGLADQTDLLSNPASDILTVLPRVDRFNSSGLLIYKVSYPWFVCRQKGMKSVVSTTE